MKWGEEAGPVRLPPGDSEIVTPWFDTTGKEEARMATVEAAERSILCEYPLWDSTGERVLMKCGWPKGAHGDGGGRIEDHEWAGMPIW